MSRSILKLLMAAIFVAFTSGASAADKATFDAAYAAADAAGSPTVYWMTQDFNTTARTLYDRVAAVTPFIKYQRKLP